MRLSGAAGNVKRVILFPVAIVCVVIGAAGAVLPVLPGWPFFFIGLSILAPRAAVRLRRRVHRTLFKPETLRFDEWRPFDVHAGFTTRRFPLILRKTDEWLDLSNQAAFKQLFWKSHVAFERDKTASGRYVILNQVHGDNVVVLEDEKSCESDGFYHFPEADGVVTNVPRLTLLVLTADCLPVFLCVARKGAAAAPAAEWVGLVHAGWRGTRAGIVEKAVKTLCERSGAPPSDVYAAFGPCIGKKRYEVGEEFREYFKAPSLKSRRRKLYFDLAGENRRQLLALGLRSDRVTESRLCTVAENRHFYSYRKEKEASGRTISFITRL